MALLTSAYGRIGHVAAADPTHLTLPTLAEASGYRVISTPGPYSKAWGEGTQVRGVAFFAQEREHDIRMGDRCLLSSDVTVATSDGHPIHDRCTGEHLNATSPVIICSDVCVGRAARVNKGVRLGLRSDIAWRKNKQPHIPVPRPETPAA